MSAADDELLDHYQRELTYLRKMGVEFARTYPKVARRLEIGPDQSDDPNVERLIESFAFLTGRVQRNIDAEFPRFTHALLGLLYPQLVDPVPSMAIARFDVDPTQGKLTTGFTLPKHTPLFAEADRDVTCRFRTCYPVTLWPIEVVSAGIESTDQFEFLDTADVSAVLRLKLRAVGDTFGQLDMDRLRFYVNADPILANRLYELVFTQADRVVFLPKDGAPVIQPAKRAIAPVGFGEDEDVLPYPGHGQPAYRVLQEYFSFPEKFRFFDVLFPRLPDAGEEMDVLLLLNFMPKERLVIDGDTFALGCTPIINLFNKMAEPLRLTQRQTEYRLVGDFRRERTTEIHSILSVAGTAVPGGGRTEYAPFFSFNHGQEQSNTATFWAAHREPTGRKELPGTETYLSFLNLDFRPQMPADQTILVQTLCTNRTLPESLPPGALLSIEEAAPLARILCMTKPTSPRAPPLGGETVWRLISHLSLNYLSLSNEGESLKALREILRLYAPPRDAAADQQIQGITRMATRRVVRRFGDQGWRGFARGIEVTLEFDERKYVGGSAFLFAAVLERFFGLYTHINSFTQLTIESAQRSGRWTAWPPRIGTQVL